MRLFKNADIYIRQSPECADDAICLIIVYNTSMFQFRHTITPRLLANIKRISVLVSEFNYRHFSEIVLVDFERRAREVSAHSSTSIDSGSH